MKVSRKELGGLGLGLLIRLGVVSERQVELLAELGGFGISERMDGAGIFDDSIVDLRCVEILLERLVLLALYERIVRAVQDAGLDVQVGDDGVSGFLKRGDLGRDRDEQRPERFQVGQKFDAMVTGFDRSKKPNFSIKAMQIAEEKQAVAQYGSSDSGASLGDILGAALKEAQAGKTSKKK